LKVFFIALDKLIYHWYSKDVLVVTTGRITFMENQLIDNVEDLKDSIIDRIHYLADMGDYLNACAVYEEFREDILNSNR